MTKAAQVLDVLYPARNALYNTVSLSYLTSLLPCAGLATQSLLISLGSLIFWAGLITQGLLIGLGIWQKESVPIGSLPAILCISYLNIATIACYGLLRLRLKSPDRLLWTWFLTGLVASVSSLALGIAAFYEDEEGYPLAYCLIAVGVLAVKSYRDLKQSKDGEDGDKVTSRLLACLAGANVLQDNSRDRRLQRTDEERISETFINAIPSLRPRNSALKR